MEKNLVRNKGIYFLQIVMSSSYLYSLYLELEYSHLDIFMIYELEYSPYIMLISYMTQSFIVHIMFMDTFRIMLMWWFIILLGTPKSFTCRPVGSGTRGDLGGHYVCGRGA